MGCKRLQREQKGQALESLALDSCHRAEPQPLARHLVQITQIWPVLFLPQSSFKDSIKSYSIKHTKVIKSYKELPSVTGFVSSLR